MYKGAEIHVHVGDKQMVNKDQHVGDGQMMNKGQEGHVGLGNGECEILKKWKIRHRKVKRFNN